MRTQLILAMLVMAGVARAAPRVVLVSAFGEAASLTVSGETTCTLVVPGQCAVTADTALRVARDDGRKLELVLSDGQASVALSVTNEDLIAQQDPLFVVPTTDAPSPAPSTNAERFTWTLRVRLSGQPLAGAEVIAPGEGRVAVTDAAGAAQVSVLRTTEHVSVVHASAMPHVQSLSTEQVAIDVELEPWVTALSDVLVRAPRLTLVGDGLLLETRKNTNAVVEVVGRDNMRRLGDANAGSALRRVTGVSLVGGRYVYVRGLGDRYAQTTVNRTPLPSPEPERRVVPLDLFPAALLDAVLVQKTWQPSLSAEFGGGVVDIQTRAPTDKPMLVFALGSSAQLGATWQMAPMGAGGRLDLLGFDDGTRRMPTALRAASNDHLITEKNALTGEGYTKAELEKLGESLQRHYTPTPTRVLPGLSMQLGGGHALHTPIGHLAFAAVGNYGLSMDTDETTLQNTRMGAGGLDVAETLHQQATEREARLGGVATAQWSLGDAHRITLNSFLHHTGNDETRVLRGVAEETGQAMQDTRLRFVERALWLEQLVGHHTLPWTPFSDELELDWRAAYALALRDEPDQRQTRYEMVPGAGMRLSDRPEGNQRLFSSLQDHTVDLFARVRVPFVQWQDLDGHVDLGAQVLARQRSTETRRYKFLHKGPLANSSTVRALPAEAALSPRYIGTDGFQLAETTRSTDNFVAGSRIGSVFATTTLPLWTTVTLDVGARLELGSIDVTTFELFSANADPVVASLLVADLMPQAALTWRTTESMVLRSSVARSVIRPELRELSPAIYTDVSGRRTRFGNPDVVPTTLTHVDVRYEWYFGKTFDVATTDSLSVAVFGKHFASPIESIVTSGADQAVTVANVEAAYNAGVELEGRISLAPLRRLLFDWSPPLVDGLFVAGNVALIASQVVIGEEQRGVLTTKERGLEGQSPWLVNAQLGHEDVDFGSSVTLVYNVFGPRIVEVGSLGAADVYEQPFHQLDVVAQQRLWPGVNLGVSLLNVLDLPAQTTQGDIVVQDMHRGRTVSVQLSGSF